MDSQFKTEGYALVEQHFLKEDWAAMNNAIGELYHAKPGEDLDVFVQFLIQSWPSLKGTAVEDNASYFMLANAHHDLSALTEELALEWGMSMEELGDDSDAITLGYALALKLYPDSDLVLESLIEAGLDCDNYYHEDAFSMGATSADGDRNIVLHLLQALSDYNYFYSEGEAEETLMTLKKDIKYIKDEHPDLHPDHLSQAMAIVQGQWDLPAKDSLSF